ncbi:HAD family phosphatase [Hydrotalea sp.]|uniref:HAD family hydrolase n=1 Tax=Hydrotalea sp. TaxID=2881279 RepID=UPI00262E21F8|nr:HAD family phosphatase [Hydrotalea sp.]
MAPLFGVAFDLDGTLINNNDYHIQSWQTFYQKRNMPPLTKAEYLQHFNGKTNADVLKYIFGPQLKDTDIKKYTNEKEAIYREIYAPHIQPVAGLLQLLETLSIHAIPMVIATSGIKDNIDFMLQHLPIRHYFKNIIYSAHITHGKPHPEIYEKAAIELSLPARRCIAFEDAVAGIISAKTAGLKVVALTTTHSAHELVAANKIMSDFSDITFPQLQQLVQE